MRSHLTNKAIARIGGFSLPQVRRWAVLVLGIDSEADKGRGVKRVYNIDEAYKIYLAGSFITILDKSLEETKSYLNYIWPILKREKLLPSQLLQDNDINKFEDYIFEIGEHPRYTLVLQPEGLCYLINTLKYKQLEVDTYEQKCKNIPIYPEDVSYTFPESTEGLAEWDVNLDDSLFFFIKQIFNISGVNTGSNLWEFLTKIKETIIAFALSYMI